MNAGFSAELLKAIRSVVGRYPTPQAALLPVLNLVQKEQGSLSAPAEQAVAALLGLKPIRVREAISFYTMFHRQPLGRFHLQVCTNLSCHLLGGQALLDLLRDRLGLEPGQTTGDGLFSLSAVECLGACEQAPCLMVNEEYYGGLDEEKLEALLARLKKNHVR